MVTNLRQWEVEVTSASSILPRKPPRRKHEERGIGEEEEEEERLDVDNHHDDFGPLAKGSDRWNRKWRSSANTGDLSGGQGRAATARRIIELKIKALQRVHEGEAFNGLYTWRGRKLLTSLTIFDGH